jgi:hypothetical protein
MNWGFDGLDGFVGMFEIRLTNLFRLIIIRINLKTPCPVVGTVVGTQDAVAIRLYCLD